MASCVDGFHLLHDDPGVTIRYRLLNKDSPACPVVMINVRQALMPAIRHLGVERGA